MVIQWSDEDQLFLVTVPEFADSEALASLRASRVVMPCTHGKTREEAIHNGEEVIEMYLEAWLAEGESIPKPSTLQIA
jgi:predicted RNase H-like HicB family nuclease